MITQQFEINCLCVSYLIHTFFIIDKQENACSTLAQYAASQKKIRNDDIVYPYNDKDDKELIAH